MILVTVRDGSITYIGTYRPEEDNVWITVLDYDNVENSTDDLPALDPVYVSAKIEDFREDNPNLDI